MEHLFKKNNRNLEVDSGIARKFLGVGSAFIESVILEAIIPQHFLDNLETFGLVVGQNFVLVDPLRGEESQLRRLGLVKFLHHHHPQIWLRGVREKSA